MAERAAPAGARGQPARRKRNRRLGYLITIVIDAVLLILITVSPGWQAVPFLTPAAQPAVSVLVASLWVALVANVVYLVADPPRLRALGDLISTTLGVIVAWRLLADFPFTFAADGWAWLVRGGLVLALIGGGIGVIVLVVRVIIGGER